MPNAKKTTRKKASLPKVAPAEVVTIEVDTVSAEVDVPAGRQGEKEETVDAKEAPVAAASEAKEDVKEVTEEPKETKEPEEKTPEPEPFSKEELKEEEKTPFYKTLFWMIIPVILLAAAVGSGIFIYQLGVSRGKQMQQEEAPVVEPSPTPTPAAILKREDLKVQVLNGAGVAGTATEAKEYLEGLGYEDVDTGNADSFDFDETEIAIKEDREKYVELLTKDLGEEYVVSETIKTLSEDSDYDAVITIGSDKAE